MKARCSGKSKKHRARYFERGISVCERWMSYENFLADMGQKPVGASLDRINNDGNYEPSNCRWADAKTQARNKSSNLKITFNGKTMTLAEWAEETGISYVALQYRLSRKRWSPSRAFACPLKGKGRKGHSKYRSKWGSGRIVHRGEERVSTNDSDKSGPLFALVDQTDQDQDDGQ